MRCPRGILAESQSTSTPSLLMPISVAARDCGVGTCSQTGLLPDIVSTLPYVQQTLEELERFQCGGGGFAYWPGACWSTSPYLPAYLLHVFKVASDLKYEVDAGMRARAYSYLERELARSGPG